VVWLDVRQSHASIASLSNSESQAAECGRIHVTQLMQISMFPYLMTTTVKELPD
jgi:hypothetical protein